MQLIKDMNLKEKELETNKNIINTLNTNKTRMQKQVKDMQKINCHQQTIQNMKFQFLLVSVSEV